MSDYVSVAEAAKLLDCSTTHVRNQATSGDLPAEKVRGKWRIRRDVLANHPRPHEAEPHNATTAPPQQHDATAPPQQHNATTTPPQQNNEWRDDLLAQVARLEASEASVREEASRREHEAGQREERSKARIIDLERAATVRESRIADLEDTIEVRDSRIADLGEQVAVLEAKVREVLEAGKDDALRLAERIADLVDRQQEAETRIYELQPVAERVPMLEAAVDEKDAALSGIHADIDAIASRPVAGPVFRYLTRGKLRR
jgi:excisionase family DNA binding protein